MKKYQEDINKMFIFLGGKENISSYTHEDEHIYFFLQDPKKAKVEYLSGLGCVKEASFDKRKTQPSTLHVSLNADSKILCAEFESEYQKIEPPKDIFGNLLPQDPTTINQKEILTLTEQIKPDNSNLTNSDLKNKENQPDIFIPVSKKIKKSVFPNAKLPEPEKPIITQHLEKSVMTQEPEKPVMTQYLEKPIITQQPEKPVMTQQPKKPVMIQPTPTEAVLKSSVKTIPPAESTTQLLPSTPFSYFLSSLKKLKKRLHILAPAFFIIGFLFSLSNLLKCVPLFDGWHLTLGQLSENGRKVDDFLRYICRLSIAFFPIGILVAVQNKKRNVRSLALLLGILLIFSLRMLEFPSVVYLQAEAFYLQSMLIPALCIGLFLRYIEKKMKRIFPRPLQSSVSPLLIFIVTSIFAYIVSEFWLRQFSLSITQWIADSFASSYSTFFGGIWGFLIVFCRLSGIEYFFSQANIQATLPQIGISHLWPILFLSSIAQGSAAIAHTIHKEKGQKRILPLFYALFAFCGIPEPVLMLNNLPEFFPLISGALSTMFAAILSISLDLAIPEYQSHPFFFSGIFGLQSIPSEHVFNFIACMLIAGLLPIVFELLQYFIQKNKAKQIDLM
ncbi:hypothetical protein FACS189418_6610 [Clostridia bacterium]|nr:hypothetical protein FACS189418_6610 [Clostridia bacterium]